MGCRYCNRIIRKDGKAHSCLSPKEYRILIDKLEMKIKELENEINQRGNCGGGWRYDIMRNCFVNQMGDTRG